MPLLPKRLMRLSIISGLVILGLFLVILGASAADLTVNTATTLCGLQTYNNVVINATVTICKYNGTGANGTLSFVVANLTFTPNGIINGIGKGYGPLNGTGHGNTSGGAGGGGGYGGAGGAGAYGNAKGGPTYDSITNVISMGSGGGGGSTSPGSGGGYLNINVTGLLNLSGTLNVSGSAATHDDYGGGSGGGIYITARNLTGNGVLSSMGGASGASTGGGGGGGGGGRVYIQYCSNASLLTFGVLAGKGSGADGSAGTFNMTKREDCNSAPIFTQQSTYLIYPHPYNISIDFNAFDADGDIITWGINTTMITINQSGHMNMTTSLATVGIYSIGVNITDGTAVTNATFTLEITNAAPTIASAIITPDPATNANDLTCSNGSVSDQNGDNLTLSYNWYKEGILTGNNSKILGKNNLTTNANWTCSINVTDGLLYSGAVFSQRVMIGASVVAPTLNYTNATTAATGIASTNTSPTNNNSWVNLSITFYDYNAPGEKWTGYFCKTNNASAGGCGNGEFCHTTINATDYPTITCRYNLSTETAQFEYYYGCVVDNTSSTQGQGSCLQGIFYINHPTAIPIIIAPSNNAWTSKLYSLITVSGSDPDSNPINMTIYSSLDNITYVPIFNGTLGSYNYTGLSVANYYIKAITYDSFGYYSPDYSTPILIRVDPFSPTLENASISATTIQTSQVVSVLGDCYENLSGIMNVSYDIYDIFGITTNYPMSWVSGNTYSAIYTPYGTHGQYNITKFYCANNASTQVAINSSLYFTATVPGGITIGGGGGNPGSTVVEGGNFSVQTDTGSNSYELYISKGQCREKDIIVKNLGADPISVSAHCESPTYSFGSACQFVNLTLPPTSTIPANNQFEYIINTHICMTQDISDMQLNESLYFNIVVDRTDTNPISRQSLSFVLIPQDIIGYIASLIGKLSESWTIDLSKINPDASPFGFPKWIAILGIPIFYLAIMLAFFRRSRSNLAKSIVYILGTVTIFIGTLILI